jgi:hypothetical protein
MMPDEQAQMPKGWDMQELHLCSMQVAVLLLLAGSRTSAVHSNARPGHSEPVLQGQKQQQKPTS